MSDFSYVELSSLLAEKSRNGLYKGKEFQGKGNRWIKMNEVYGNDFFLQQKTERISVNDNEEIKFGCQPGDLLFGRTSLTLEGIGSCLIIGDIKDTPIFESNLFRVRLDREKACPLFYYYFFKSIAGRALIQTIAKQTAATSITSTDFVALHVPYFPLKCQQQIAELLFKFDKKIHSNTQTNQTLESIAQAIFKSWFVDFEPVKAKMAAKDRWYAMQPTSKSASPVCYADEAALPDLETYTNLAAMCAISGLSISGAGAGESELAQLQQQNPDQYQQLAETAALFPSAMVDSELGEIPEGWEPKSIYDICDVIYGAPFKSTLFNSKKKGLPLVRIRDLKDESAGVYTEEAHPKGYLIQNGDLIAGMDGEFRSYIWGGNAAWMNQRICCFKPKEFISTYLLKGFIDPHLNRYEKTATATTVIHLGKGDINNFSYLDAGRDILEVFNAATENLSSRLISNKLENLSLTQLRDSLLPKLLSGEIDLTKIENEAI